ncbi:hypothetical protein DBR42_27850 [Pelomonas sp. HMWF004]|nr:hypothetical protein DBR42_27850 [Pelomonas sp. HMWF004]
MRDTTNLMRWLDLSWFAPIPLSIGLSVWSVITRPNPETAGTLLLMQMALMAVAAAVPAGIAASRSHVWRRRLAPLAFTHAVHRVWRQQTLALLALGLIGPATVAVRAIGLDAISLACWALALPVLGTAVGMLAAWAWAGSLTPAALMLWPGIAGAAVLLWLDRAAWVTATGPAMAGLIAALLLMGWVWRTPRRLTQRWSGVAPLLARWRPRKSAGMKRWRWAPLAFANGHSSPPAGAWSWLGSYLPFIFFASPVKAVQAAELTGWASLYFVLYIGFMVGIAGGSLVIREDHWRLRLAPTALRQSTRIALMVMASAAPFALPILAILGLDGWRTGLAPSRMATQAAFAVIDVLLCIAFVACVRGFSNRRLVMTLAWLALMLPMGGTLALLAWKGYVVQRGAAFLGAEVVLTLTLLTLAARQWRSKVLRSDTQWGALREDAG